MNAPFRLTPSILPTVAKPEFAQAMLLAKQIGNKPTRASVIAWAAAMKKALR